MATSVYVDGFNLYYGALKGTKYKWLDLEQLARVLLPRDELTRIRYFTARVSARPENPSSPQRQDTYLRALRTLPLVSIHEGHFLSHRIRMPLAEPPSRGPRTVEVVKTEEKGSDVNLATYLLRDGFKGEYDVAVVVSNDSDLTEPIRVVKDELGLAVGIVNPHPPNRRSRELQRLAPTFFKQLREPALRRSQLPDPMRDTRGRAIHKPPGW
ncbi:MAG: NYN domain-containing protein [Egibacteraceae bacterium]